MILSTIHYDPTVVEKQKTDLVMYYNATKGGVDTFDQLCGNLSVSRKTNRWPLCLFYGMLNIAANNAYILYHQNKQKVPTRRDFFKQLAVQLCQPFAISRLQMTNLNRPLRTLIHTTYKIQLPSVAQNAQRPTRVRRKCALCDPGSKGRFRNSCSYCGRNICDRHTTSLCDECI